MNTPNSVAPKARLTSFAQLFGQQVDNPAITKVEIPLIQRDYAQGRNTIKVEHIRGQFINAVCAALLPKSDPIELDFIYGDVDETGKFMPLDGQQRLTFLFLLHCYLAWQAKVDAHAQPWANFSYATRPSAREFCQFLTQISPDSSKPVSAWIKNQADYLPTWDYDPSIRSMLVVLDDLQQWFAIHPLDFKAKWAKLTDAIKPAIQFHLLPLPAFDLTDEVYIKMNSRGKLLTPFENFKAQFEEILEKAHPQRARDFAVKIDTIWSDILWKYRGDDNLIDDEFLRYFRFVTDICAWNCAVKVSEDKRHDDLLYLTDLAEKVYGLSQPNSVSNLDFLFHAFDVWQGKTIKDEFEVILTVDRNPSNNRLRMFNPFKDERVDLFHACCRHYGTNTWVKAHTLLLYGVLLRWSWPRQETDVSNFTKRLRVLRNLIEASPNEIRPENMPGLLADIRQLIVHGAIDMVGTFNKTQKQNELDKADLLRGHPALETEMHTLEDHDLLRGGLNAFDLNPGQFQARARSFLIVFAKPTPPGDTPWLAVSGALLAKGIYSPLLPPRRTGYKYIELGSPKNDDPWRNLFRKNGQTILSPLMDLLDAIDQGSTLLGQTDAFLSNPATVKDWRYYFVNYPEMRQGASGIYRLRGAGGYEACMLEKTTMSSYYADPFLFAVFVASGIGNQAIGNRDWPKSFYGYEDTPRWLVLRKSGLKLRSVDAGWEITCIDVDPSLHPTVNQIATQIGVQNDLYSVPQQNGIDTDDRIHLGAGLLTALINAGL